MEKITFGFRRTAAGNSVKLVVCEETKQYEYGVLCVNSTYIDVFVTKDALETIENHLIKCGYKRTDLEFKKRNEFDEYKQWCKDNGLKPSYATSLEKYFHRK